MPIISPNFLYFLVTLIFTSAVFMHLVKKNSLVVKLYLLQSIALASLLAFSHSESFSFLFIIALVVTVIVKIIIAPTFFLRLIRKHKLTFSVSSYLNLPMTLIAIAVLTALTKSSLLESLATLAPERQDMLFLSVAAILVSIFLSINRKGALSQMLSVLSLENSIVSFALLAGLEQNPGLELGITFDILIWIIIATLFGSMIYQQFGSLDVTVMKKLTE